MIFPTDSVTHSCELDCLLVSAKSDHTSRYSRQPYANEFDQPFSLEVTIILPPTLCNVHKVTTCDATLPSNNLLNPDLPLVPITIRSMLFSSAKSSMPPAISFEEMISVFI